MSIAVFTDSAANIPAAKIEELNIHVIPCSYELGGKIVKCPSAPEDFDGHGFYDMLRAKTEVRTSMTNSHDIAGAFAGKRHRLYKHFLRHQRNVQCRASGCRGAAR